MMRRQPNDKPARKPHTPPAALRLPLLECLLELIHVGHLSGDGQRPAVELRRAEQGLSHGFADVLARHVFLLRMSHEGSHGPEEEGPSDAGRGDDLHETDGADDGPAETRCAEVFFQLELGVEVVNGLRDVGAGDRGEYDMLNSWRDFRISQIKKFRIRGGREVYPLPWRRR